MSSRAPEPATRPRTLIDACVDAAFDALAAGACLLAWTRPQALPGVDLIAWTAPLAFVQIPLALIAPYAGVLRVTDPEMPRATKAAYILAPTLIVGSLATLLLGLEALFAVAWVSASLLWRVWRGGIDREAAFEGAWIDYASFDGLRRWRVLAGHSQVMQVVTLTAGVLLAFVLPFIELDRLGVTIAIEQASAWAATPIGGIVGAPTALAAGTALFSARALVQFEGIGRASASPKPTVDNDPVLRDIVRKLDGDPPPRRRKRRR